MILALKTTHANIGASRIPQRYFAFFALLWITGASGFMRVLLASFVVCRIFFYPIKIEMPFTPFTISLVHWVFTLLTPHCPPRHHSSHLCTTYAFSYPSSTQLTPTNHMSDSSHCSPR
jgi:hypothetical protein